MRRAYAVLAMFALTTGCKSQKVIELETEVAAAKARVASLDKKRREVLEETKRVEVERKTFAQQADEAELAKARLVAAGLVLHGDPIPDSVLLEDALRNKSADLGKLAANIVQRQLPCVSDTPADNSEPDDGPGDYGEDCAPPELPDECEGVVERTIQSFTWSCGDIIKVAGARPVAVCTASGEWSSDTWPLDVPTARIDAEVLRLAMELKGRLYVADWPNPSTDLYRPHNDEELTQCAARNDDARCIRACEEKYGRIEDVCRRYYDDEQGDYDDSQEGEDPAVARARAEAEAAEAEAARAREELGYQECLAACEPSAQESEEAPDPVVARLELRKERFPGVFAFDVSFEDSTPDAGALEPNVLVVAFPMAFVEGDDPEPTDDTVDALAELLLVKSMSKYETPKGTLLFGPSLKDLPSGAVVTDGKEPAQILTAWEVCAMVPAAKQGAIAQPCAVLPPPPPVKDAGVDAGVVDAGIDAGVATDGGAP
ncbi:MAG: hypothetical protein JNM17_20755 [Archangium sp.]|nr:hypothetical protein [Archangium sp.]